MSHSRRSAAHQRFEALSAAADDAYGFRLDGMWAWFCAEGQIRARPGKGWDPIGGAIAHFRSHAKDGGGQTFVNADGVLEIRYKDVRPLRNCKACAAWSVAMEVALVVAEEKGGAERMKVAAAVAEFRWALEDRIAQLSCALDEARSARQKWAKRVARELRRRLGRHESPDGASPTVADPRTFQSIPGVRRRPILKLAGLLDLALLGMQQDLVVEGAISPRLKAPPTRSPRKPTRDFLASLETRLKTAGFSYAQIGRFLDDGESPDLAAERVRDRIGPRGKRRRRRPRKSSHRPRE